MYGVLVLNDSSVDDNTVREGLKLTRLPTKFSVTSFNVQVNRNVRKNIGY